MGFPFTAVESQTTELEQIVQYSFPKHCIMYNNVQCKYYNFIPLDLIEGYCIVWCAARSSDYSADWGVVFT